MSKVSNTSNDLILIKQLRVVKSSHSKVMKQLKKHFVEKRRDTRYNKHVYQTLLAIYSPFTLSLPKCWHTPQPIAKTGQLCLANQPVT